MPARGTKANGRRSRGVMPALGLPAARSPTVLRWLIGQIVGGLALARCLVAIRIGVTVPEASLAA